MRHPITYIFHYRAKELSNLEVDPGHVYLVLTPATTTSTSKTITLLLANNKVASTLTASSSVFASAASITSGPDPIQNPPKPLFASVQGNSGQLTYSYPLTVAPGPPGTEPDLALNYSSGTTNARNSPTTPAGPAGEGWTFSLGDITAEQYPDGTIWYSISGVDGVRDRLIPNKNNSTSVDDFGTEHMSYFKIQKIESTTANPTPTGQPYFLVWDKDGTEYEFGYTSDSLEYYIDSTGNQIDYDFALDKVTPPNEGSGTNNRTMVLTYVQDKESNSSSTWIRDFALKRITYGTTSNGNTTLAGTVDFFYNGPTAYTDPGNNVQYITAYTSAYRTACNLPATASQIERCDDPLDRSVNGTSYVDPDVMSTLELTGVKSYVGSDSSTSQLDYAYTFNYTDTTFTSCPSADTTLTNYWCAGNHLLTGVTPTVYQNGTGHALAGITFGYSGVRTNKYDDSSESYHMENAWNYLTSYHDHSNGTGITSVTYHTASNNSHGTPYNAGDNRYDTLYCVWHASDCSSSPWSPADDKMWTEQVVTQIVAQGQDSSASGISSDTTNYDYWLTKTGGTCPADSQGNTDCVGFGWMPDYADTTAAADYYHGEFRGFGTVLLTSPSGNLTVDKYATTFGWNSPSNGNGSPATDPRNYLAGSLLEEDAYTGSSATCSKLISQTTNIYAGESAPTPTCSSNTLGTTTPAACSSVYVKSPYTACEPILLTTRVTDYEQTGNAGPWTEKDFTYDDYRSTGTTTGLGSFYASPATGSYHNLQQEVTTSSNASTETQNWTYYTTDTTVNGWVYYDVNKVAHSEIGDSAGTKWSCSDTTYDEGVASGVPTPAAGWPTTVKTYSTCGTSSSAITTYTGYDADGNVVASVDGVGAANPGLYNSSGCTLTTAPKYLSSSWTAGRFTACTAYSAANALTTDTWNALGQHTQKTYDATQGLLTASSTDVNNQVTNTSYSYDSSGAATVQVKAPGETGSYTQQSVLQTSCTDSSVYPCLELDNTTSLYSSAVTRTFYDSMGRSVETLTPGADSAHTIVTFTVYNDAANTVFTSVPFVVASRTTWLDPNGATDINGATPGGTSTLSDAGGRTLTVTDPLSHVTTISYSIGSSGVSGDTNSYVVTTTVDANSHESMSYADALGNTIYEVEYSGLSTGTLSAVKRTTTAYDVLGDPTSVTVTDLAPQTGQTITTVTTTASYDALGRKTVLNDPDRGTHTYTYDANDALIGDSSGSGSTLHAVGIKYDLLGRVGCVQDTVPTATDVSATGACSSGVNPYTVNTYDADPSGVSWSGTNYAVGHLTQSVTTTYYPGPDYARGVVTENYQYDQRGQTVAKLMNMGVTGGSNVTFPAFPAYEVTLAYNDAGQPTTTQTTVGGAPGYTFTQAYDSTTGVQTGLSNSSVATANLAALSYNARGLVSDITLKDSSGANLADENVQYDGALRPASATTTWSSGGSTIYSDGLSYDNVGNVISRLTTHASVPGVASSGGSETQNFCYNEQNQLVWASNAVAATPSTGQTCGTAALQSTLGGSYTNNYVYTHLGQIWQAPLNGSGTQEQYLYCNTSQPHQVTALAPVSGSPTCSSTGTTAYSASYDTHGNMVSRTYPSTTTAAPVYDGQDQMVRWSNTTASASNEAWYMYDAAGNRVMSRTASTTAGGNAATAAATITVYAFGLEEHVYSYVGSGSTATNLSNTYYYALAGHLIGMYDGTSTSFTLTDLLGSVVATISNVAGSATILGNQLYGPYGNQRYSAGSVGTTKGFTGQHNDGLTGLDYYNARYYDPVVGRFLQADTVQGNPGGFDPYAYVGGNPETVNDPSGHCVPWCVLAAGFVIGALAGGISTAVQEVLSGQKINWGAVAANALIGGVEGLVVTGAGILLTSVLPVTASALTVTAEAASINAAQAAQVAGATQIPTIVSASWRTVMGASVLAGVVNGVVNGIGNHFAPSSFDQASYNQGYKNGYNQGFQAGKNAQATATASKKPSPTGGPLHPPVHTPAPGNYISKKVSGNSSSASSSPQASGAARTYTVQSGDSLWAIAARFYGSGTQWTRLYQANSGVIGNNPNLIFAGERLRL